MPVITGYKYFSFKAGHFPSDNVIKVNNLFIFFIESGLELPMAGMIGCNQEDYPLHAPG